MRFVIILWIAFLPLEANAEYVQRDKGGNVTGIYANKQLGYAEEWLDPNDAEVTAHKDKIDPTDTVSEVEALKRALIKEGVITEEKVEAEKTLGSANLVK